MHTILLLTESYNGLYLLWEHETSRKWMNCWKQGQGCDAENTVSEKPTVTLSEIKGLLTASVWPCQVYTWNYLPAFSFPNADILSYLSLISWRHEGFCTDSGAQVCTLLRSMLLRRMLFTAPCCRNHLTGFPRGCTLPIATGSIRSLHTITSICACLLDFTYPSGSKLAFTRHDLHFLHSYNVKYLSMWIFLSRLYFFCRRMLAFAQRLTWDLRHFHS